MENIVNIYFSGYGISKVVEKGGDEVGLDGAND
jgi:hypothetical protein